MRNWIWIFLLGCGLLGGGCLPHADVPRDRLAPTFKGQAPRDQEHYSLLDLLRKGPVLAVFIPRSLENAGERLAYFELVAKARPKGLTVIGLIPGTEKDAADWVAANKPGFAVIPDVDGHYAEQYEVTAGPVAFLIARSSEKFGPYAVLDQAELEKIQAELARLTGSAGSPVDLSNAAKGSGPAIDFSAP